MKVCREVALAQAGVDAAYTDMTARCLFARQQEGSFTLPDRCRFSSFVFFTINRKVVNRSDDYIV
jgi:hypothetical protein